jgi:hypothetical protein
MALQMAEQQPIADPYMEFCAEILTMASLGEIRFVSGKYDLQSFSGEISVRVGFTRPS